MTDASFAARIRERYPEGLTGVFAIGGTRTTYILEQNRDNEDPGRIDDFFAQGEYLLKRYWQFIEMFYNLGGKNAIVTTFSFRGFYNRGQEYAAVVAPEFLRFIDDDSVEFYQERNIDPYFCGVDSVFLMGESSPMYEVGQRLNEFQKKWPYQEGRNKLVWEVASIPLYSFWRFFQELSEEERAALDQQLASERNLEEVYRTLYRRFARAVYGADIPMPHFYLGTNKSGDLKWRSPMPMALSGGDYLRSFYTPYPSLFTTPDTLQAILEDLAFGKRFYSAKTDYSGQFSRELAQAEYQRVMELSADPETTLGFSRQVNTPD